MKIAVIGSRPPILGFSLAGIKDTYPVATIEEAEQALTLCIQDTQIGIILIEKYLADNLSILITAVHKKKSSYPIILPIPGDGDT